MQGGPAMTGGQAMMGGPQSGPPPVVSLTAPAGARVTVIISERLSASGNNVGDGFSGVLAAPLETAGGRVVFPRRTHLAGRVVAAKGLGRFKGSGALGIEVTEIGGVRAQTTEYEREAKGRGRRSAAFIGGGGGAGALIGGLAGGGRGALIGGVLGAGGGAAGAAFTGDRDVVIPAETVVDFRLTAPLTITRN
jgi:hypothetical protein